MPECLFVSPYSNKFLTGFSFIRFYRHFNIKKYLKSLKVLFFFSVIFPQCMFFKRCVQISHVRVKLVIAIEENWMTGPTFLQLNG